MKNLGVKNILITGGSGKIGKHTIPELLKAGYKLRAIELPEDPVELDGIEKITGSLSNEKLVKDAIKDIDFALQDQEES